MFSDIKAGFSIALIKIGTRIANPTEISFVTFSKAMNIITVSSSISTVDSVPVKIRWTSATLRPDGGVLATYAFITFPF